MPLLQKSSAAQPEQTPPSVSEVNHRALLAQLADLVAPRAGQGDSAAPRKERRRGETQYDRVVRAIATVIGLIVCLLAWIVGAYFTLSWLASFGLTWAAAGIAPLAGLMPGTNLLQGMDEQTGSGGITAWVVWGVPLAVTLAEVGFDPGRTGGLASRLLWSSFLIADTVTTALGLYPALTNGMGTGLSTVALAAAIGLLLALVPEKLARRLIRENL